jgi:hypothetical protein
MIGLVVEVSNLRRRQRTGDNYLPFRTARGEARTAVGGSASGSSASIGGRLLLHGTLMPSSGDNRAVPRRVARAAVAQRAGISVGRQRIPTN